MKDRNSYKLDLDLLLSNWQTGLYGTGTEFVCDHSVSILSKRLVDLFDSYEFFDPELDHMLENDSVGGGD